MSSGCGGNHEQQRLTITGSSTVAPVMSEIARSFTKQYPQLRIDVQTGGSSRGLSDALNGRAEMGMMSRALTAAELEQVHSYTIGIDGIAPIVHADLPVAELSREQLRAVFTGAITNWSQLGGPDLPITVISKAEGRATLTVLLDFLDIEAEAIKAAAIIGDNAQGIATVRSTPSAISYVSIGAALRAREQGAQLRLLAVDGVSPTVRAISSGDWPLKRPLNLVLARDAVKSERCMELLVFARAAGRAELIESLGFVAPTR